MQKLGLAEAHCTKFNPEGDPPSYFRGRYQIDGVWHARKIIPTAVSLCPFHFSVGDHRACIVDFQMTSALGELSVPLHVVNKRRLICSFPLIVNRYLKRAEDQLQLHNIPLKINSLKNNGIP